LEKSPLSLSQIFFFLHQLPKNQFISLLEVHYKKGIQYVRSPGTKSIILKMDSRTGLALVKLPSNVKKFFSVYSVASLDKVALKTTNSVKNTSAG
jgi:ribosomal protein L2